jgi:hypothetical protein
MQMATKKVKAWWRTTRVWLKESVTKLFAVRKATPDTKKSAKK